MRRYSEVGAILAGNLISLREMAGLSQRRYALILGIGHATLSRIELGRGCDFTTLVQLRKATGLSYGILLGEETSRENRVSVPTEATVTGVPVSAV